MSRYNLLTEPWVSVIDTEGRPHTVSLREALLDAEDLAYLGDPDPGVEVAVLRLMIAAVHAAAFRKLVPAGESPLSAPYPRKQIAAYLDEWEHRFDLFDAENPFFQAPHAAKLKGTTPMTLAAPFLAGEGSKVYAPGGVVSHDDAMDPADAARYLLCIQAWGNGQATSGPLPGETNKSTPAGVLAGSLNMYPMGTTLAQTLLMNITPTEGNPGKPVWEVPSGTAPTGWLGRLAWPSRSYLMDQDRHGRVVRVYFGAGHRPEEEVTEPHFIYRKPKKDGADKPVYLRGSADRALWRETPTIYGWRDERGCEQANRAAEWLADSGQQIGAAMIYGRDNVGMSVASVQIRAEIMLPVTLLGKSGGAVDVIITCLEQTTKVSSALRNAIAGLNTFGKDISPYAASQFWPDVEPFYFALIRECAATKEGEVHEQAAANYREAVREMALSLFAQEAQVLSPLEFGEKSARLRLSLNIIFKETKKS